MKRFIEGEDRTQVTLLPACLEDYVEAENPVRVVEVFVDGLDLGELGFEGVAGARGAAQHRTDVANWTVEAGLQDHCQLPQGQWAGDPQGVPSVHRAVPPAQSVHRGDRCHRW